MHVCLIELDKLAVQPDILLCHALRLTEKFKITTLAAAVAASRDAGFGSINYLFLRGYNDAWAKS
jgi:hypothetical protein